MQNTIFKLTVLKNYFKFRYFNFSSREKLQKYQKKKFIQLSSQVLKKSPYYKLQAEKVNSSLSLEENLNLFPVLTKQQYLANFDKINTCKISLQSALNLANKCEQERSFKAHLSNVDIGLSSGTSGTRGLFLVNEKEKTLWAGLVLARVLKSSLFATNRIALVLRSGSDLYHSVQNGNLQFKYFDLTLPFTELYNNLISFNPTVIVAPPSFLEKCADIELNKSVKIIARNAKQIISAAEILYDDVRKKLESVWNIKIEEIYQATEGFLAFTCKYGTLHLNEDCLHIEKEYIANNEGKKYFLPIITDLYRSSQPLLRYRLTDVLEEDLNPCLCGSVFHAIKKIESRYDDILVFDNKNIFPSVISEIIFRSCPSIVDFKIIQNNENNITISLNFDNKASLSFQVEEIYALVKKNIINYLNNMNIYSADINFSPYIENEAWVKRRRVYANKFL